MPGWWRQVVFVGWVGLAWVDLVEKHLHHGAVPQAQPMCVEKHLHHSAVPQAQPMRGLRSIYTTCCLKRSQSVGWEAFTPRRCASGAANQCVMRGS